MTPEELVEYLATLGEPKYRAVQLFSKLQNGTPLMEISNLSLKLRATLSERELDTLPRVEKKLVSRIDGTVKYLYELHDGETVESVFMRYKHGNTMCISTQVGCRMGCTFCASTKAGLVRSLAPSEMLLQILECLYVLKML